MMPNTVDKVNQRDAEPGALDLMHTLMHQIKRRMREAYRLHKADLLAKLSEKGKNLSVLIKYNSREIRSFNEIEQDMRQALRQLAKKF